LAVQRILFMRRPSHRERLLGDFWAQEAAQRIGDSLVASPRIGVIVVLTRPRH
jgi:hypothetical protein